MSWNEPGDRDDSNKKKDPWGRQDDQGPPNLDEIIKQLQQKLRSLFGSKSSRSNGSSVPLQTNRAPNRKTGFIFIAIIVFVIYGVAGIYVVDPAEEAVVLRFGRYIRTDSPGLHWIAPIVESKDIVNVQEVKTSKRGGPMLTEDENIVNAEIAVQYRISNPRDYLFNVVNPEKTLEQVSDSALRAVVGESTLNEVLTSGRSEIGAEIRRQIQIILTNYQSGLEISDLAVQQTKAPEEVKAAFDDAIKAQQDEERLVNEAYAYAHKVIPIAEGKAKRVQEEAEAYKEQVTLDAQGKAAKFTKILPEYKAAPQVTRDRMYFDTLQQVYMNTSKIVVDVPGGNNLLYLPLDKLMEQKAALEEPVKEENNIDAVFEKTDSNQSPYPRRLSGRPTYEDAERPHQSGE